MRNPGIRHAADEWRRQEIGGRPEKMMYVVPLPNGGEHRMRLVLISIAATMALGGCNRTSEPNNSEAAPVTHTAAQPALGRVEASFDCARAKGQAQELICGDNNLAAMDREAARLGAADPTGQAAWVTERDACGKADELRQCVLAGIAQRIHQLRQASPAKLSGDGISIGPIAYSCKGIEGPLSVTFINSDPGALAIEWGGVTRALDHVVSADGGKYEGRWEGQFLTFWTKGREATLTIPGKGDLACTEAEAKQ
jgi:uncharacterized protein